MEHIRQALEKMPEKSIISGKSNRLIEVSPTYFGLKHAPPDIVMETPEGVVFYNLQVCYVNRGNISEGLIEDIIWGFRQSGIPNAITWDGFLKLKQLGYIFFHEGTGVAILGQPSEKLWYRWTKKYYALLANSPQELEMVDKIKPLDTTMEKIES